MSKYDPEQLKKMAQTAIVSKQTGDGRYFTLCMSIALINNMSANEIYQRIIELAK